MQSATALEFGSIYGEIHRRFQTNLFLKNNLVKTVAGKYGLVQSATALEYGNTYGEQLQRNLFIFLNGCRNLETPLSGALEMLQRQDATRPEFMEPGHQS